MVLPRHELANDLLGFIEVEPVAAGFANAYVEPNRRVETRLLSEHEVGEFKTKILAIFFGLEVVAVNSPIGNSVHNAMDELGHARLSLRRAHPAMEIFAGDDVGR